MGELFDIGYSDPTVVRTVGRATIRNRLIASEMGREFYDGARENGYGGYRYDGRWKHILPRIIERYGLTSKSRVLDVGCKKGFLLRDLEELLPGIDAVGVECSMYPLKKARNPCLDFARYDELQFRSRSFDFVIAWASIYMLDLGGVVRALREIQRVSNGKALVSVGAYTSNEGRKLFAEWSLLGATVLHVDEWPEVFAFAGYTGDYWFTTAESLNLRREVPNLVGTAPPWAAEAGARLLHEAFATVGNAVCVPQSLVDTWNAALIAEHKASEFPDEPIVGLSVSQ